MTTSSRCVAASRAAAAAAAAVRSASIAAIAFRAEQQQGGVEHVLAGRAHVHGAGGVVPDGVLQRPHQRRHGIAGVGRLRDDGGEVQPRRVGAGLRHRVGGRRRHQTRPRGGAGERGLHLEQGAEPRVVGDGGGRSPAGEGSVEETAHALFLPEGAHTAKNTVSRSPCRWTSKR